MVEKWHQRRADFAILFHTDGHGGCVYSGLSVFNTDHRYVYTGNLVAAQSVLRSRLCEFIDPALLDSLSAALTAILASEVASHYRGPLGVDMMVTEGEGEPVTVAELNLRNTMGHVSLALAENIMAKGHEGVFSSEYVDNIPALATTHAEVSARRLVAGTLFLTPPVSLPGFAFTLRVTR